MSARLVWLVPIFIVVLGLEYHAIVRWEESLLESRRGDEYRAYAARCRAGFPAVGRRSADASVESPSRSVFLARDVLQRARHAIAIAVGYLLLWIKYARLSLRLGC